VSAVEENQSFDLRLLWLLLVPGILIGGLILRIFVFQVHDRSSSVSASTSTMAITVPTQVGRCAVPTAQQLAQQPTALEATATSVDATSAVLRTTRVLAGHQVGQLRVTLPSTPLPMDAGVPRFTVGDSYLLAISSDGTLAGCGLSGQANASLEKLYTSAFG
jgi:hypothetical protein